MFHHSPFLYRLILLLQRVFIRRIIRMGQHHMLHTALPSSTNYSQSLPGTKVTGSHYHVILCSNF